MPMLFLRPIKKEQQHSSYSVRQFKPLPAVLLLLKLKTVEEHGLQLSDVIRSLYWNAHPAW